MQFANIYCTSASFALYLYHADRDKLLSNQFEIVLSFSSSKYMMKLSVDLKIQQIPEKKEWS